MFLTYSLASSTAIETASLQAYHTENFANAFADIDAIVNETLEKFNVPGAAVGIVVDDKIVLTRGYGFRDLHQKLPVTENTLFPIASCTKAFTALVLGQLVDEGKISWDDPVINHIPEFRLYDQNLTSNVTIRDLVAHRTGVSRNDILWIGSEVPRSDVLPLLPYFEPACPLREKFLYTNFMYTVAGIVIERATGQTWEEAVSQRIFKPLGMSGSNLSLEQLQKSPDYSLPYTEIDDIVQAVPFRKTTSVGPASAINSNMTDMVKWTRLQLSKGRLAESCLVRGETLQEMHTLQIPLPSPQNEDEKVHISGYGLGWMVGSYRAHQFISHGGLLDGFSSEVAFLPQDNMGVVILTNNSSGAGRQFIACIRNIIFDKLLGAHDVDWTQKSLDAWSKEKQSMHAPESVYPVENASHPLQDYAGRYFHPAYGTVEFSIDDKQLVAVYGNLKFALSHKTKDAYQAEFRELLVYGINPYADVIFFSDAAGDVNEVHIPFEAFRGAKAIIFKK